MATPKFPITIKRGSAVVRIYRTENCGYEQFTVCFYEGTARKRLRFSDLAEAKREAESKATSITTGDIDVLTLKSEDRALYVRACNAVRPLGIPLDLAVVKFADATKRLGETPLADAVDYYLKHCPRNLPRKTVSEVYEEMLKAKGRRERH